MVEVLVKLAKQYGKTVILAAHDPRVAVNTDRILRLEDGRLVGEVKPIDLERSTDVGVVEAGERSTALSELIKIKITNIEKEINEIEEKFKKSEVGIDAFYERVTKLKLMKEALTELLTSIGSS